jgi:hypothetical protein
MAVLSFADPPLADRDRRCHRTPAECRAASGAGARDGGPAGVLTMRAADHA